VALRYFASEMRADARVRGQTSLLDAARGVWPDLSDEETTQLRERLAQQLDGGGFHYLLVAQHFTPTTLRTVEYLNATMPAARFYVVELIRFSGAALAAFESRTVLKPPDGSIGPDPRPIIVETAFLKSVADDEYREALRELLEVCRGLGLRFGWGKTGTSIRVLTGDNKQLSVAWLFPPGVSGWMGLRDLTLGFDLGSIEQQPAARPLLDAYLVGVGGLPGAEPTRVKNLNGYHFPPAAIISDRGQIAELFAELVRRASETL